MCEKLLDLAQTDTVQAALTNWYHAALLNAYQTERMTLAVAAAEEPSTAPDALLLSEMYGAHTAALYIKGARATTVLAMHDILIRVMSKDAFRLGVVVTNSTGVDTNRVQVFYEDTYASVWEERKVCSSSPRACAPSPCVLATSPVDPPPFSPCSS